MIVADTNLVAYVVIPGEQTNSALRVRSIDRNWIAPGLLRHELINVIAFNVRKGILSKDEGIRAFRRGLDLVKFDDRFSDPVTVLNLCEISKGASYDAEFVWLAMQLHVPLVTGDGPLVNTFPSVVVHFKNFAK